MDTKILSNKGLNINDFYLPPFDLNQRELLGIMIGNDNHSEFLYNYLKNYFSKDENYSNSKYKLNFSKHFIEKNWLGFEKLFPTKIGQFLKRNANQRPDLTNEIYKIDYIKPSTRIDYLPGNPRRLMTLINTISKSKYIIFDTFGQDDSGVKETLHFVKKNVIDKGGSAIWIDNFGVNKNLCTKFITIEKNNKPIESKKFEFKLKN